MPESSKESVQRKAKKVLENGGSASLAILDDTEEINGKLDEIAVALKEKPEQPEIQKVKIEMDENERDETVSAFLSMLKGKKGDKGDTPTNEELLEIITPLIPNVKDGKTPTREELLALIRPLIPEVKNGETPSDDRLIELITPLIPTVENGKDGSPDTPEQVRDKLESLREEERLDIKYIKGLDLTPYTTKFDLNRAIGILDERTNFLINKTTDLRTAINNIGSGTLAGISAASLTTAQSLYRMTSGVPVEFQTSGGTTLAYLDEPNARMLLGANSGGLSTARLYIRTSSTNEAIQASDGTRSIFFGPSDGSNGTYIQSLSATGGLCIDATGSTSAHQLRLLQNGNISMGTSVANNAARLHIIKTTEQLRVGYDTSNYFSTTVGSTGAVTHEATGSGATFRFNNTMTVSSPSGLTSTTTDTFNVLGNTANRAGVYIQNQSAGGQSTMYLDNSRGNFGSYGGFLSGGSTNALSSILGLSRADRVFFIADGASNLGLGIGTLTNVPVSIGTNNVTRMSVLGTGEVRINAIASGNSFSVAAAAAGTSITNTVGFEVVNTNATVGNWGGMYFADTVGGSAGAIIGAKFVDRTNDYADLSLATRAADGFLSRLYITSAGLVGVGRTPTTEELEVAGTVSIYAKGASDNVAFQGYNSGGTIYAQMKEASSGGFGGLLFGGQRATNGGGAGVFFVGYTGSTGVATALEFRGSGGTIATGADLPGSTNVATFSRIVSSAADYVLTLTQTGDLYLANQGTSAVTSASAKLHVIKTTEQLRLGYNTTNYLSTTVSSIGGTDFAITSTSGSPIFTFNKGIDVTGNIDGDSYSVGGSAGATGTFTTADLKTVTVVGGIITSIV